MAIKRIGILGAMPEEINGIVSLLDNKSTVVKGMRTYYVGTIDGIEVVVVFSRWGKVAAATTVTHLIVEFGVTQVIFTGVAGAISHNLNVGDFVVADSLVQHDLDARPIMKRFEIPLLGKTILCPSQVMMEKAYESINGLVEKDCLIRMFSEEQLSKFSLYNQKVYVGQIASGDKFFSSAVDKENLLEALPDVLCVEMEGAAVAQVCFEYNIPYLIIRVISDDSNENSVVDFKEFVTEIASVLGVQILQKLLSDFKNDFQY